MEKEIKPIFRPLDADDPEPEVTKIESLCMTCFKKGNTRLLLTKIPFYKDVIICSFYCEHCGYQNNEIQSSGPISSKGIKYTVKIEKLIDLNRKIVKSDYTSVRLVELDFEIPARSQKGEVTTIEGILDRSIRGLEQDQEKRKQEHPITANQIECFINKLCELKDFKSTFTMIIEDASGNCFVENLMAPQKDPSCSYEYFTRTKEQNEMLGFFDEDMINKDGILHPISEEEFTLEQLEKDEVLQFPTNCSNCSSPCQTNMKVTNIPYFKEVVIMATSCDICGHRTNEVKSGGGIEPKGLRIEVVISCIEDFTRDVLKSETCSLFIPELELEMGPTTLGGRFTTIEGLLVAIRDQLIDQGRAFVDSEDPKIKQRMDDFIDKLNTGINGKLKLTVCLDDPAGNSYVQSMADSEKLDDGLKITHYNRTFEQNEELGLNDIKTENYE